MIVTVVFEWDPSRVAVGGPVEVNGWLVSALADLLARLGEEDGFRMVVTPDRFTVVGDKGCVKGGLVVWVWARGGS